MFSVITQEVMGKMLSIYSGHQRQAKNPVYWFQTVKYSFLDPDGLNDNLLFLGYKMCCPLVEKALITHCQKINISNYFLVF